MPVKIEQVTELSTSKLDDPVNLWPEAVEVIKIKLAACNAHCDELEKQVGGLKQEYSQAELKLEEGRKCCGRLEESIKKLSG